MIVGYTGVDVLMHGVVYIVWVCGVHLSSLAVAVCMPSAKHFVSRYLGNKQRMSRVESKLIFAMHKAEKIGFMHYE